jgi:hypothetical protein
MLTVRITRAFDQNAPAESLRALADECLIACAFFEERLRRNGAVRHYVGLGQTAYDAARLTEQAYGFVHMRDVIASAAGRKGPRTAGCWWTAPAPAAPRPRRSWRRERGARALGRGQGRPPLALTAGAWSGVRPCGSGPSSFARARAIS